MIINLIDNFTISRAVEFSFPSSYGAMDGLLVRALDSQFCGPRFNTPQAGSKIISVFHPPEVDQMNTKNSLKFSGKK